MSDNRKSGIALGFGILVGLSAVKLADMYRKSDAEPEPQRDCIHSPNENRIYTVLPTPLLEYIKDLGRPVLEMCAGTCNNKISLQKAGVECESFDMHTHKCDKCVDSGGVKYALCGTIENAYPGHILLVCEGIDVDKSVSKYTGDTVVIGGHGKYVKYISRTIEMILDTSSPKDIDIIEVNRSVVHGFGNENNSIECSFRPRVNWMRENKWELKEVIFGKGPDYGD